MPSNQIMPKGSCLRVLEFGEEVCYAGFVVTVLNAEGLPLLLITSLQLQMAWNAASIAASSPARDCRSAHCRAQ